MADNLVQFLYNSYAITTEFRTISLSMVAPLSVIIVSLPMLADVKHFRVCIPPEFKDTFQLVSFLKLQR